MSERSKVAEFVSFCIEMFAKAKKLSGDKVAAVFMLAGQSTILTPVMMSFTRRANVGLFLTLTSF